MLFAQTSLPIQKNPLEKNIHLSNLKYCAVEFQHFPILITVLNSQT